MNSPQVLHERRGAAYWIIINRPARRNALNEEVIAGIVAGIDAAHAAPEVRAIVLTGAGDKAFCAGGDLSTGQNFQVDHSRPTLAYADLMRLARRATLPVIGRINGSCVAGGMGLLGIVDIAVAVEHAKFGLPEIRVGLFAMQVIALLQSLVPKRLLREWCLTGELFDARTAREAGLLNAVVSAGELDKVTDDFVEQIRAGSPMAAKRGIHALNAMEHMGFSEALAFGESQLSLVSQSDDAREGLAAFNEKRKPRWKGQ